MPQTFRDTQFSEEHSKTILGNGDPYAYGRMDRMTGWERWLNRAGRMLGRGLTRIENVMVRLVIQIEITHLRLRLRTLYKRLGKLVFYLRVGEDRRDALEDSRTRGFLSRLEKTHAELASQRMKLQELFREKRRDEFAGA
ncbi:hypothetical protein KQI52_16650 [bacterium]|nr:hypothetical protein [bacterium]